MLTPKATKMFEGHHEVQVIFVSGFLAHYGGGQEIVIGFRNYIHTKQVVKPHSCIQTFTRVCVVK